MPRRPAPLPASLGTAFSVAAARAAGVPANRLRARDLESPFRGVRVTAADAHPSARSETRSPQQPWELARDGEARKAAALAAVMPAGSFLAGRTAAVLLGLPVDPGPEPVVGVFAPARAPRRPGVRGVKVERTLAHVHTCEGLRMTSPASTWAMLGAELSVRELVVVGDSIVRVPRNARGRPQPHARLGTIADLQRAAWAGRRVGVARLRTALDLIRVGSASPLETEFRLDAAAAGLPEPELDVEIRDRVRRLLGISEVVYREQRVAVEIEGDHHRTDRAQWNRDIDKYAAYAAEGWEVVRLTSAHIRGSHPRAVGIVLAALVRRGHAVSGVTTRRGHAVSGVTTRRNIVGEAARRDT